MRAYIILIIGTGLLASCSAIKSTSKSDLKARIKSTVKSDLTTDKFIDTKTFGDSLKGSGYLPVAAVDTPKDAADSIETESAGIRLKIKVTPKRNKAGAITGNRIEYTAIAKPVKTTSTHEAQHGRVRTTTKTDSTKNVRTTHEVKKGFGLPSWIWWIIGLIAVLALVYFLSPLLSFIKKFIK